jgi:hypothetical protein
LPIVAANIATGVSQRGELILSLRQARILAEGVGTPSDFGGLNHSSNRVVYKVPVLTLNNIGFFALVSTRRRWFIG